MGSPPPRVAALLADLDARHPRSVGGAREARAVDEAFFDRVTERFLAWGEAARGETGLSGAIDAYVEFSHAVNLAQARYEVTGAYPNKSHADCLAELYATSAMHEYLWGVYLTTVLWPHHLQLLSRYHHEFVTGLPEGARLVELASGHGGWGQYALAERADLQLRGFDIAPAGVAIATRLAAAAGLSERASYHQADALALPDDAGPVDAVVCCFLLEHLDDPAALMTTVAGLLRPGGRAWVTGALTAAQADHIYEFVLESELLRLAEDAGLRVAASWSLAPPRTLRKARYLPRSMAMVLHAPGGRR